MLKIFNSLTRKLEEFKTLSDDCVRVYNCGPTVYDYFHIGNARNFITFDNIRRYLIYKGFKVLFIQNITDIDDKIIKKANEEKCSFDEVSSKFTRYFFKYQEKLGILPADYHPRATEVIKEMIEMVEDLIAKGYAYECEGDVFFSVEKFKPYGKLSGKKVEDLQSGARIGIDQRKRNPIDFVLWKGTKPGEPYWESPWGKGRPGWHLECSAMSKKYLGEQIDIHGGGVDLEFPHHENEIAQSEACSGKEFVQYFVHNGFLEINGEKMSKSLGNFFTINEVLEKYSAQSLRFFMCLSHYRKPLDYCEDNLINAQNGFGRIEECYLFLKELFSDEDFAYNAVKESLFRYPYLIEKELQPFYEELKKIKDSYETAMDEDFNFPQALSTIFELVKFLNKELRNTENNKELKSFYGYVLLNELSSVLGLQDESGVKAAGQSSALDDVMELVIDIRAQVRKEKNYALADQIRDKLKTANIEIKDSPQGSTWTQK